jgi:formylglycine-generating enzyme required for sulfatase activity
MRVVWQCLLLGLMGSAPLTAQRGLLEEVVIPATGERVRLYQRSWAVLIGIDDYQSPRWPDLQFAEADVEAVQARLRELGFGEFVVLRGPQATRERILEVLGDDLPRRVGGEDRVLIYFAGHGQTEELSEGKQQGYLVPVDGDRDRPYATAISMVRLQELAECIGARHVFFAVDACYSGFALVRSGGGDPRDWEGVRRTARFPARQIVTAGRAGEVAIEREGHGLFTRLLLQGLSGDADRYPPHGVLTGSEVGLYLESYVPLESGQRQTPQFGRLASGEGEFLFVLPQTAPPPPPVVPPPPAVAFGHLQVNVNAPGSQVYVNGTYRGEASPGQPLNLPNLSVGTVEVRVEAQGYRTKTGRYALRAGEWTQVVVELEVIPPPVPPVVREQPSVSQPVQTRPSVKGGEMVRVPAGEFTMGSKGGHSDEKPEHRVYLEEFYIDKYEVTVAQYRACVEAGACTAPSTGQYYNWGRSERENHPINGVDWDQAQAYCGWAGKRLPSEAEWEKAARGTDGRTYPWGNATPTCGYAVMSQGGDGCGQDSTWPVGSKPSGASP